MSENHVYAISAGDRAVKIGRAIDPQARLEELKTGHYEILRLHYAVGCTNSEAPAIEKQAHILLMERRVGGEWFDVSVGEAIAAIDEAVTAVKSGITKLPPRLGRSERFDDEEMSDGRIVSDEEAAAMLNGAAAFMSTKSVSLNRFSEVFASAIKRHFDLGRHPAQLVGFIVRAVAENEDLTDVRLAYSELRSLKLRIESWEMDSPVLELLRHGLIYITSEKDVYKVNKNYFSGQESVRFVKVIERVDKDAAA